ncbi:hypothetical protein GpartN1_g4542.t1 [Galdieria partita]|uniref:Peptidase M28 domain-containing protein n=1 Tax=Galdieria partita TaxID=83374 RepID=A0A9C7PZI2_9RHOD|nr:hypothetical protein GpartN1_g4542.t1 [Galdieria partita]
MEQKNWKAFGLSKRSTERFTSHWKEPKSSSRISNREERTQWSETKQWLHVGFILLTSSFLIGLSYWGWSHEPQIVSDNEATLGYFSAERAFQHVDYLSSKIGPRAFGTRSLESAQKYIWQQVEKIQQYARDHSADYSLQLEWQTVSGTHITQRHGRSLSTSCYTYQNVTNIIAILCNKKVCDLREERDRSLLVVNGHVDSAIGSPGASDDAIACGVMLEMLFSWIRNPNRNKLKHPVIFLFNGAEETFLNGAHGFVTGWKWIAKVGALLNLESSGSGGLALLFRSGPKNAWLSKAYAKAVTRPHASVVAQDIFEKELIPSETDFRVFWEFASIPGIDLANYINGETYHTRRDAIDRVTWGLVQHMGDSAVQLVEQLVAKEDMIVDAYEHFEYQDEKSIYYDVLGLITVYGLEKYWNVCFIILLVLTFQLVMKRVRNGRVNYSLVLCFYPVWIVSCMLTFLVSVSFGWFLHSVLKRSMSWYGKVGLAEWIFGSLGLALVMKLLPLLLSYISMWMAGRKVDNVSSFFVSTKSTIYEPIWLSYMLFEATMLVLFVSFRLRLSYLPAWDVLCSLLVGHLLPLGDKRWQFMISIIHFIPIALFRLPCGYMAIATFVPMMGRIGDRMISDMIIGGLCSLFTVLSSFPLIIGCMSYSAPFHYIKRLVALLFCCSLVLVTMIRIPYDADRYPKRLYCNHLRVMDTNGQIEQQGLFLRGLDARKVSPHSWYNDMPSIQSFLNETKFEWGYMSSDPWNDDAKKKESHPVVSCTLPLSTKPWKENAAPQLVVLEDSWNDEQRVVRVKLSFPGGNMARFSFNASLLNWSLSSRLPRPNSKGFMTVRHLRCHDCDDFEFSFTTKDRKAIAFDLVNILFSWDKELEQLQSMLPVYVTMNHCQSYCSSFLVSHDE